MWYLSPAKIQRVGELAANFPKDTIQPHATLALPFSTTAPLSSLPTLLLRSLSPPLPPHHHLILVVLVCPQVSSCVGNMALRPQPVAADGMNTTARGELRRKCCYHQLAQWLSQSSQ
ncbi:hypothetical protein NQZ68_039383 [Dissostichus eleginoides]|nr:hypothetical protein NQZ68_039383 [Dissostichus eleginoides]